MSRARAHDLIADDYPEGGTYSVLIEHPHGSFLNRGSCNRVRDVPGYYRRLFQEGRPPLRRSPDALIIGCAGFNPHYS
ncbi:MAG: hypothetical protein FJW35_08245 [Acidobacteria bacterium]|nr:hypothetical protein [Acidobacteriota bacterium]